MACRSVALLCLLAAASPRPLGAQWLTYATPGAPRTASGAVDLNAPPPKSADGHPDLSGIWKAEDNRPCPREGCDDMHIGQEFLNIGWGIKGGLPYQPWAAELARKRTADLRRDDPQALCLPTGVVRMHTTPLYRKIVQAPGLLMILNERNAEYRQIFTDGRPLPVDPQPAWNGYSSARWEGDVLVVTTSGFRDGLWLDAAGSPLTDAATIVERFRRVAFGRLEIQLTVDDPKAYTATWTTTLRQFLAADTELLDYYCLENEKDVARYRK
jgi:hypothetical protein